LIVGHGNQHNRTQTVKVYRAVQADDPEGGYTGDAP
jgi:hypothetical protein